MLAGNYPCQANLDSDNPSCHLCRVLVPGNPPTEDMVHLLTACGATLDTRSSLIPSLLNTIVQYCPSDGILENPDKTTLTQFILDPSSLNLSTVNRINPDHPGFAPVLANCRNYCFVVHKERTRQLKQLKVNRT